MMGVEVDLATHLPPGEELPPGYLYVNIIIVCIFIFELAIKLTAYGLRLFFCGSEYLWNWFDVVIVVTSLVETIMDVVPAMQDDSLLFVVLFGRSNTTALK